MIVACLTLALMSPVALFASIGRGYLPALGWAILTLALAQIAAATGWGDWFPWSVPALLSQAGSPRAAQIGLHSKPVGLLNTRGYYDPLLAFLEQVRREKFIYDVHRALLAAAPDPHFLLRLLQGFSEPEGLDPRVSREQIE